MSAIKFPYWSQLPTFDLYLDQVLLLVNELTDTERTLTASMVNNYVKHQHIEKPIKKKYQTFQVAQLILITQLKQILSINDITDMMTYLTHHYDFTKLYDAFIARFNNEHSALKNELIDTICQTLATYQQTMAHIKQIKESTHYEI